MGRPENQSKTIREYHAYNRIWLYLKVNHGLNLSDDEMANLVEAVEQYKKDLTNGMSTKPQTY